MPVQNLSAKDVFEKCKAHMLTQKVRSQRQDANMYHGPNNLRCPVGTFMDRRAASSVEGLAVTDDEVQASLNISVDEEVLKVLKGFQDIHDSVPEEGWASQIHRLGRRLGFEEKRKLTKNGKVRGR